MEVFGFKVFIMFICRIVVFYFLVVGFYKWGMGDDVLNIFGWFRNLEFLSFWGFFGYWN